MPPSYNTLTKNSITGHSAYGGVMIAIRWDLHFEEIPLRIHLQMLAVAVYTNKTPVTICTAYFPPGENLSENQLSSILNTLPKPFIFKTN